nr:hypothetical protein [Adonisia turfae]
MTEFYRQLSLGETKAQSLGQAMLMTMEKHQHLAAWSVFTLIGVELIIKKSFLREFRVTRSSA